jgi:hypothetical protein
MNPIIALWAHPRSMSTAFERIMRERGDCTCFHEPFLYDYYVHRALGNMPMLEVPEGHPVRYEDIKDMLLSAAETGPVFFKDMSYYIIPRIYDDVEFFSRLTNAFLVRNPHKSILSYYKLDQNMAAVEIGIEAQWQHFNWLKNVFGEIPVVIEAETVQADPQNIIGQFWKKSDLEFRANAFSWQTGDVPQDWEGLAGWHGDVATSSGIKPPEPAAKTRERFQAAAMQAPLLKRYLDQHMPYYELLCAHALTSQP